MIRRAGEKVVAGRVAQVAEPRRSTRAAGLEIHLASSSAWTIRGRVVDYPGNPRGQLRARVASATPGAPPTAPDGIRRQRRRRARREVVLLVDPRPRARARHAGIPQAITRSLADDDVEARVDGRRVELEARDEIVLRCGEASITLAPQRRIGSRRRRRDARRRFQ